MTRLTKNIYSHEFSGVRGPFNLRCGQIRSDDTIHNGGWYNIAGERLGFGDLSVEDIIRIRDELEPGEAFIILSESDSFWNFVHRIGPIGSLCQTTPDIDAPGLQYVLGRAQFVIVPGHVYLPRDQHMYDYCTKQDDIYTLTSRRGTVQVDAQYILRRDLPALLGVDVVIDEDEV